PDRAHVFPLLLVKMRTMSFEKLTLAPAAAWNWLVSTFPSVPTTAAATPAAVAASAGPVLVLKPRETGVVQAPPVKRACCTVPSMLAASSSRELPALLYTSAGASVLWIPVSTGAVQELFTTGLRTTAYPGPLAARWTTAPALA